MTDENEWNYDYAGGNWVHTELFIAEWVGIGKAMGWIMEAAAATIATGTIVISGELSSYELGIIGEKAVGISASKTRIPSATGTAAYRIPDKLTKEALIEVKNVKYLSNSAQLKDFLIYSESTNR